MNLSMTKCCGVFEIDGLSDFKGPEGVMVGLASYFYPALRIPKAPFITFTGVTKLDLETDEGVSHCRNFRVDNYGQAFADYIVKHKLGTVISSEEKQNWSKNFIKIWVWHLDHDAIYAYYSKIFGVKKDAKA